MKKIVGYKMKDMIQKIIEQQRMIAQMLGYYDLPLCKDGLSDDKLKGLEKKLYEIGYVIPDSYKEFLKIHDGIENISCSFSLLGSSEFSSEEYLDQLSYILESGIGYDFDPAYPPLMIGASNETSSRVFFEYKHERNIENEPVVLEGEPGFLTLHYSFYDFLQCRIDANEKTISSLAGYIENNTNQ